MKRNKAYTIGQFISCLVMILALAWLTVCTPFVYRAQQLYKEQTKSHQQDNSNPLSNTVEEKNESSVNTLNEYLHENPSLSHPKKAFTNYSKCHATELYFAYHPELLSPPPEA